MNQHRTLATIVLWMAALTPATAQISPGTGTAPTAPADASASITIPDGTAFHIQVATGYSSATSKVGDEINFTVVNSIWIDSIAVLSQGMLITGKVVEVVPARRGSRSGHVTVAFDQFTLPTGEAASIRATLKSRTAGDKTKSGLKTAGELAGYTVALPPGILIAPFFKGDEKTVANGADEVVYVNGPLRVNRAAANKQPPPSDAGLALLYYLGQRIDGQRFLYCGDIPLGSFMHGVSQIEMKPGAYWFSAKRGDPRPVKLDLEAGQYYFVQKEHGELVVKHFQANREFIDEHRSYTHDFDLSKVSDVEMRQLTAGPPSKRK